MKIADAENEKEFIEAVRDTFKAYVPESDAWAEPNFFDINSTIIGGLFWSGINEARNGIDARMNPQTAVGDYLDMLASQPPINLTRQSATQATGDVFATLEGITTVPVGYVFKTQAGIEYVATESVDLVGGKGIVTVLSKESGGFTNSIENQTLTAEDGAAQSMGIYGGYDAECDEQLRRRMFAAKSKCHFFGSQCSMQDAIGAFKGVTRSWVIADGAVVKMLVLMEDKYACGQPRQEDFDEIKAYFEDECLANMFFCPIFESPEVITIAPEIDWRNGQPDICEVVESMRDWLRETYDLGEAPTSNEIQSWIDEYYGEYSPKVIGCCDYEAKCNAVYNCVELLSCGE